MCSYKNSSELQPWEPFFFTKDRIHMHPSQQKKNHRRLYHDLSKLCEFCNSDPVLKLSSISKQRLLNSKVNNKSSALWHFETRDNMKWDVGPITYVPNVAYSSEYLTCFWLLRLIFHRVNLGFITETSQVIEVLVLKKYLQWLQCNVLWCLDLTKNFTLLYFNISIKLNGRPSIHRLRLSCHQGNLYSLVAIG